MSNTVMYLAPSLDEFVRICHQKSGNTVEMTIKTLSSPRGKPILDEHKSAAFDFQLALPLIVNYAARNESCSIAGCSARIDGYALYQKNSGEDHIGRLSNREEIQRIGERCGELLCKQLEEPANQTYAFSASFSSL